MTKIPVPVSFILDEDKVMLTPFEKYLLTTLGEVATELFVTEDKFRRVLTPVGVAMKPDITGTIFSQLAEKCTDAMCACIPVEENTGDKVYELIDEHRDPRQAVTVIEDYFRDKKLEVDLD